MSAETTQECPLCFSVNNADAKRCRRCGQALREMEQP